MDIQWIDVVKQPFVWGLSLGAIAAIWIWKSGFSQKRMLKKENKELSSHLNTQLKINAEGNKRLDEELVRLKEQNEQLRTNLALFQQKPDQQDKRIAMIYERAISLMRERAPGFAPAWELAMREAADEHERAEKGLGKMVRNTVAKFLNGSTSLINDKTHKIESE